MAFSNLCMGNFGCYCYSLSREHELIRTPKLSLFRHSNNSTQWQCFIARARITWRLSNVEINKRFRNFEVRHCAEAVFDKTPQVSFLAVCMPVGRWGSASQEEANRAFPLDWAHFHDGIDYNGVAFFNIVIRMGSEVSRDLKMGTFTVKKLSKYFVLLFNNRLALEPEEVFFSLIILTNFVSF